MNFVADRLSKIKPSMTVGINVKAKALKDEGKDVIVLAAGEPDFNTPKNIRDAASKAMEEGKTKYVPGKGTPELQKAIQKKFREDNNIDYQLDEIICGVGGKHIIYNAMMATINPGDEVIITAPFWVSYPDIVLLAEGNPVIVKCPQSQNFKITPEQLEKNNNPERPDWLPEKFASVEAMAQAYTALEQKMGKPEEQEAPAEPSEPETTSTPSNNANEVSEVLDSAGLDFDVFQQEYNENGELSPDAYQALEEAGFPRSLVETYIQGQEALATSATNSMYEIAGGQEGYSQMMEWASNNLDPSEIEAYNATVDTGDEGITRLAVQGLVARYRSEVGTEPSLVEGTTGATSGGRFESAAEVTAAMRDPRYQNDPAYRQRVAQMMARSSVF